MSTGGSVSNEYVGELLFVLRVPWVGMRFYELVTMSLGLLAKTAW